MAPEISLMIERRLQQSPAGERERERERERDSKCKKREREREN